MNNIEKKFPYLPIGTVARAFGVSENNIRRMEAAGLVHPVREPSGYRYYSVSNLSEIATVLTLKSFGFVYDDIRHNQLQPGDRNYFLNILIERRNHIDSLIQKLSRTTRGTFRFQWEILEYPMTCCFVQTFSFMPTLKTLSEVSRSLLYESIRRGLPVDYTRPILIDSEFRDYHEFDYRTEQKYTLCMPLREITEGEDIRVFPGKRAISLGFSNLAIDIEAIFYLLEETLKTHGLRQCDTLRATMDIGGLTGTDDPVQDTVLHFLVPVCEKEPDAEPPVS